MECPPFPLKVARPWEGLQCWKNNKRICSEASCCIRGMLDFRWPLPPSGWGVATQLKNSALPTVGRVNSDHDVVATGSTSCLGLQNVICVTNHVGGCGLVLGCRGQYGGYKNNLEEDDREAGEVVEFWEVYSKLAFWLLFKGRL
jgi:hypothetical protein